MLENPMDVWRSPKQALRLGRPDRGTLGTEALMLPPDRCLGTESYIVVLLNKLLLSSLLKPLTCPMDVQYSREVELNEPD